MSEMKVYHHELRHNEYDEFYLKYEADKVISELESKLDIYKRGFKEDDKTIAFLSQKLRHQKYKRCLAMAKLCYEKSLWWYSKGYGFEKYDKFWEKWRKRWQELANKFKEV